MLAKMSNQTSRELSASEEGVSDKEANFSSKTMTQSESGNRSFTTYRTYRTYQTWGLVAFINYSSQSDHTYPVDDPDKTASGSALP